MISYMRQSGKWNVRKFDGAWGAFDDRARLRYASAHYRMALAFALMRPKTAETIYDESAVRALVADAIERAFEVHEALQQTNYEEDEDE